MAVGLKRDANLGCIDPQAASIETTLRESHNPSEKPQIHKPNRRKFPQLSSLFHDRRGLYRSCNTAMLVFAGIDAGSAFVSAKRIFVVSNDWLRVGVWPHDRNHVKTAAMVQ